MYPGDSVPNTVIPTGSTIAATPRLRKRPPALANQLKVAIQVTGYPSLKTVCPALRRFVSHSLCVAFRVRMLGDVKVHADTAMVNLNVWLTPDSANLGSPETDDGGGLTVFHAKPPGEEESA